MAHAPLATAADLAERGIDPGSRRDTLLNAASAAVRSAAGCPISQVTSTIKLPAVDGPWLALSGPVTAVSAVEIDDVAQTDFQFVSGRLYRFGGWRTNRLRPSTVKITLTHGLPEVPEDIVDLVCSLVGAAADAAAGGYMARNGLQSVKADDASETYTTGADAVTGPMELPRATREWLRERFGQTAVVSGVR